ncbi:GGDEF domain-containing protein [Geomonas sp. RF6]|uniref:GGDEF domain-containing protein n=1 Tax=Geomonas sp. RF6 TaxID=2897342 RepID=UPI001E2BEA24|nr:GGDEF domain-containing protein [Geomonas sp. RF6]UFS72550.1 GGDEF domain-containing protein [Geomonas sp. RF6]
MSTREVSHRSSYRQEETRAPYSPGWKVPEETGGVATVEQQLAEARFLVDFCRAIYGERDPKVVCAIAAQALYDYFGYRLAQFSFVDGELESVFFMPRRKGEGRGSCDVSPVELPLLKKRRFSLAGSGGDSGFDITVRFPMGLGQLRIVEVEQETREASAEFLQRIADCLAMALDTAIEHSRLQELSLRDPMTGLLNRRAFEDLLDIEEERRDSPPLSVLMIDIDDFKSVNDRFGHPAGDEVISSVGKAIVEALRGADLAARYGGEEFAVLLPATVVKDAYSVAERLRSRIAALAFDFCGERLEVTASLGVANRTVKEDCSVRELLGLADQALYEAKRRGKNRTLIQDPSAEKEGNVRHSRKGSHPSVSGTL